MRMIMGMAPTTPAIAVMTSPLLTLQRLLVWSSPALPIGSFGYSGGMETAIADGRIRGGESTRAWIAGNLEAGAARNDAILAVEAHRHQADARKLAELAGLCLALTAAAERHAETQLLGDAFVHAARAWPASLCERLPQPCPYPVAFGALTGAAGVPAAEMLLAFLTAHVQAQISVAVRLSPLGQSDGLAILASLEPHIARLAQDLSASTTADLGSIGIAAEIAAMAHETLETRIFRS
jgi:urease accessory protein